MDRKIMKISLNITSLEPLLGLIKQDLDLSKYLDPPLVHKILEIKHHEEREEI